MQTGNGMVLGTTGSSGGLTVTGTGTAGPPNGIAFNVNGSPPNIIYGGTIRQTTNNPVVALITVGAGKTLAFNGAINASNGNGIQISGVASAVNFSGVLTLSGGDAVRPGRLKCEASADTDLLIERCRIRSAAARPPIFLQ
jgi:hypothetical protein